MRIKISLSDGTTKYTQNVSKRKVGAILAGLERENVKIEGSAAVEYTKDYMNSFDFSSSDDFINKVTPCLDKEIVNEFSKS